MVRCRFAVPSHRAQVNTERAGAGALMAAARDNDVAAISRLAAQSGGAHAAGGGGVFVCVDDQGRTALHHAAAAGHLEALQLLLELTPEPAEALLADEAGRTPLALAALAGSARCVRALLRTEIGGMTVGIEDDAGASPLHLAAGGCFSEVVAALLEAGADANAKDASGRTPLICAAGAEADNMSDADAAAEEGRNKEATIECLLEWGARADPADASGATALHAVARTGPLGAVAALLRGGGAGSLFAVDGEKRTPVHAAADAAIKEEILRWQHRPEARWSARALEARGKPLAPVPALDELMSLTGLDEAKEVAIRLFEMVSVERHISKAVREDRKRKKQQGARGPGAAAAAAAAESSSEEEEDDAAKLNGGGSAGGVKNQTALHCVFTGNPGTGKTTIARLLGRAMFQIGCLKSDAFVETDGTTLADKGLREFEKKLQEAENGVLFIDEARSTAHINFFVWNEVLLRAFLVVDVVAYSAPMAGPEPGPQDQQGRRKGGEGDAHGAGEQAPRFHGHPRGVQKQGGGAPHLRRGPAAALPGGPPDPLPGLHAAAAAPDHLRAGGEVRPGGRPKVAARAQQADPPQGRELRVRQRGDGGERDGARQEAATGAHRPAEADARHRGRGGSYRRRVQAAAQGRHLG